MSPSEIAFLAIGLVLGAALGGALAQVVRTRPAPRREVRLTITPNAIPARRSQTLASRDGIDPPVRVPTPAVAATTAPAASVAVRASGATVRLVGAADEASPAAAVDGSTGVGPDGAAPPQSRTRVPSGGVVLPATAVAVPVGEARVAPSGGTLRDARPIVNAPRPPRDGDPPASARVAPATTTAAVAVLDRPERPRPAPSAGVVRVARIAAPTARPVMALDGQQARDLAGLDVAGRPEAFTTLVRPRLPVEAVRPGLAAGAIPVAAPHAASVSALAPVARPALAPPSGPTLTRPRASSRPRASERPNGTPDGHDSPSPASVAGTPGPAPDPCAGQRRTVEERCALSDVAREQARRAADTLREAQRAYDMLRDRVDRAEALADPRQVAAAKERLHAAFRAASDHAQTADETEAAARSWLNEINALNNAVRDAHRTVESGTAELRSRIGALERLSAEADAARIASENAEAGCREAREGLAACEEAAARARVPLPPEEEEPHPFARAWPVDNPDMPEAGGPSPSSRLAGLPLIVRVLRGDREARDRLVATLTAGDPEAGREWGLRISRLADAIMGRAIEDGYLDLPDDDPFWRLFSHREARDIVSALSALGFRFDGMGGFADGRAPAARDLSLAVGYAGLDRMRIRTWPRDSEIAVMYERAHVAADEWLADQAGDLSLGRMVDALGNRAADLADVWNAWGRVRPALLAT